MTRQHSTGAGPTHKIRARGFTPACASLECTRRWLSCSVEILITFAYPGASRRFVSCVSFGWVSHRQYVVVVYKLQRDEERWTRSINGTQWCIFSSHFLDNYSNFQHISQLHKLKDHGLLQNTMQKRIPCQMFRLQLDGSRIAFSWILHEPKFYLGSRVVKMIENVHSFELEIRF